MKVLKAPGGGVWVVDVKSLGAQPSKPFRCFDVLLVLWRCAGSGPHQVFPFCGPVPPTLCVTLTGIGSTNTQSDALCHGEAIPMMLTPAGRCECWPCTRGGKGSQDPPPFRPQGRGAPGPPEKDSKIKSTGMFFLPIFYEK